jgi:hypothetical protein
MNAEEQRLLDLNLLLMQNLITAAFKILNTQDPAVAAHYLRGSAEIMDAIAHFEAIRNPDATNNSAAEVSHKTHNEYTPTINRGHRTRTGGVLDTITRTAPLLGGGGDYGSDGRQLRHQTNP